MNESQQRIWDRFLTQQDRAHLAAGGSRPLYGFGKQAAVLSIDNYRWVIGDRPQPLLEAIRTWPGSTGLAGWQALERIQELFAAARAAEVPVIHVTGDDDSGVRTWARKRGETQPSTDSDGPEQERRFEIVPQAAPLAGETVLRKTSPSAFFGTPLTSHLISLGVDTIIVCGESTSGCVRASVVDGRSYRFRVIVVEECVYDRHEAPHALSLFDMHQKYADVLSLQTVLRWMASLDQPPAGPHLKV